MSRIAVSLLAMAGVATLLAAVMGPGSGARAQDILANGGFESWSSPLEPDEWGVIGNVSLSSAPAESGNALLATGSVTVSQFVPVTIGAGYTARAYVQAVSGTSDATIELVFMDGSLGQVGVPASSTIAAPASFTEMTVSASPPAAAVYVGLRLRLTSADASAAAVFDTASLDEVVQAAPTATPTSTPTPEPVPTEPDPSESPEPGKTPVPPKAPTVPAMPGAAAGPVDTDRPPGELLANRGFSFAFDGVPWSWDNFGGTLAWSENGGREDGGAATFISLTDSTKWMFQVVPVTGGTWYEASAFAKVSSGEGEAWVSILWYASVDGSGTNIGEAESASSVSREWVELSTGPVRAPEGARSARFRLVLQDAFPVAATFDDASFAAVAEPAGLAVAPADGEGEQSIQAGQSGQSGQQDGSVAPGGGPPGVVEQAGTVAVPLPPRTGGAALQAAQCSLCISEVVADPAETGRDAPFEWVEIVNRSGASIDTAGWQIGDSNTLDAIPATVVAPGAYLVVAGRSATFTAGVPVAVPEDGEVGSGLNNDDDVVRLVAPDGSTADTVAYGTGTDLGAAAAGLSLALDESTGTWLSDMPPSPGASAALASATDGGAGAQPPPAALPITRGGAKTDSAAWIVLGTCVAAGVFAAPFAWRRSWPEIRARMPNAR